MRRRALLGLLLAVGCAGEDTALRVMTFNVLCVFCGGDEYDPWDERLPYLRDVFKRHQPDLIGLQELTFAADTGELLARNPEYAAIYFTDGEDSYADAAIFYRKDRFEVVDYSFDWLSPTPDVKYSKGFAGGQVVPRLMTWARLTDLRGGRALTFGTTHFDNNAPAQDRSAPLVLEKARPRAEQGPLIMTGDFNSQTYDPAYARLTTTSATIASGFHLTNTFDLAKEWTVDTNQSPVPEYPLPERIDHIFVAGADTSWEVSRWTVDLTQYGPLHRYPSDHRAMLAVLDFSR